MEITPTARYPAYPIYDTASIVELLKLVLSGLGTAEHVCKDLSIEDINRVIFALAYEIRIINNYAMAEPSVLLAKQSNQYIELIATLITISQNKILQRKDRIFQLIDQLEPAKPEYTVAQLQTELKLF